MMKKTPPAASPAAYVKSLSGWRRRIVAGLRAAARKAGARDETIKWGNIVYFANGPVLVIRAEDERVLFGFWRGRRLREIEPRLKPGGKYEMATLELREDDRIAAATATRLVRAAMRLNRTLGDPTRMARKSRAR
jgi:hypothetical protein